MLLLSLYLLMASNSLETTLFTLEIRKTLSLTISQLWLLSMALRLVQFPARPKLECLVLASTSSKRICRKRVSRFGSASEIHTLAASLAEIQPWLPKLTMKALLGGLQQLTWILRRSSNFHSTTKTGNRCSWKDNLTPSITITPRESSQSSLHMAQSRTPYRSMLS